MSPGRKRFSGVWLLAALVTGASTAAGQSRETFSATAVVETGGGGIAMAPLTVTIDRKMSHEEAGALMETFRAGGAAALRKALEGVPSTGTLKLGAAAGTPTRLTLERATDTGRLLTIVTDTPILFVGAGAPSAKPRDGYDFAVLDLVVDASGNGSGTLAPAARISVSGGAFVVADYGSAPVRLTEVRSIK